MHLRTRIFLHLRELYRSLFSWIPAAPGTIARRLAFGPLFRQATSFRIAPGVFILGFKNISLGRGVAINRHAALTADRGEICLGDQVYLGDFSIISGDDGAVHIGSKVLIGPHCLIQAANHRFERTDIPIMEQGHTPGRVVIEDDVWIGGNAVVCPGAHIGRGCVIGAGAVVVGTLPPNAVAVGVPARVIRFRGAAAG